MLRKYEHRSLNSQLNPSSKHGAAIIIGHTTTKTSVRKKISSSLMIMFVLTAALAFSAAVFNTTISVYAEEEEEEEQAPLIFESAYDEVETGESEVMPTEPESFTPIYDETQTGESEVMLTESEGFTPTYTETPTAEASHLDPNFWEGFDERWKWAYSYYVLNPDNTWISSGDCTISGLTPEDCNNEELIRSRAIPIPTGHAVWCYGASRGAYDELYKNNIADFYMLVEERCPAL